MAKFKRFTGNYIELIDKFGLPPEFYAQTENYDDAIEVDLPRTNYIYHYGTVTDIKERLKNRENLTEFSYTQGNFDARVFTESLICTRQDYQNGLIADEGKSDFYKAIRFSYINDFDVLCGFSMAYMRDDSDITIPVNQRPKPFVVTIIEGVNKIPSERTVTYIAHEHLLPQRAEIVEGRRRVLGGTVEGGEFLSPSLVPDIIEQELNSRSINELIRGLIDKRTISVTYLNELRTRLNGDNGNYNIDGRDTKLYELFDLLVIWTRLVVDQTINDEKTNLMHQLLDTVNQAYQEVNYFKDKTREDVINLVNVFKQNPIVLALPPIEYTDEIKQPLQQVVETYQRAVAAHRAASYFRLNQYAGTQGFLSYRRMDYQLKQSFQNRHLGKLIIMGAGLLAGVTMGLILTGMISTPVAFPLAALLTLTLVVSAICAAALLIMAERTRGAQLNTVNAENIQLDRELGELDTNYLVDLTPA